MASANRPTIAAVMPQASAAGTHRMTAIHRVARNMTPWTHHRSGTVSRSSYAGVLTNREFFTSVKGVTNRVSRRASKVRVVSDLEVALVRLDAELPPPAYAHP